MAFSINRSSSGGILVLRRNDRDRILVKNLVEKLRPNFHP